MKTLAFLVCLLPAILAAADDPQLPPPGRDTLQAVLDRIKVHAASGAWKQPGFKDDAIEAWLDKLVGSIARAAERPDLKLPLRMKDVAPGEPQAQARGASRLRGALVVGGDIDFKGSYVHNSILLATENVHVLSAADSIIIAGGVVKVHHHLANSVIVAGALIDSKGDGWGLGPKPGGGSILVSRGFAQLGEASYGTIVVAPDGITLSNSARTANVLFVNAPAPLLTAGNSDNPPDVRSVRVPDLPLERLPRHPIEARLSVRGVVFGLTTTMSAFGAPQAAIGATALVLQFEGQRYIVDQGQPILDEAGAPPVAALRDWKLASITGGLAVLTRPDSVVVLRTDAKNRD